MDIDANIPTLYGPAGIILDVLCFGMLAFFLLMALVGAFEHYKQRGR